MAGGTFKNETQPQLPTLTPENKSITYKEFDVHNKPIIGGRDSQRFVVGSDGKVYYTPDHYATWIEVVK
jgi:guanyl-specific ribonuclease Sa